MNNVNTNNTSPDQLANQDMEHPSSEIQRGSNQEQKPRVAVPLETQVERLTNIYYVHLIRIGDLAGENHVLKNAVITMQNEAKEEEIKKQALQEEVKNLEAEKEEQKNRYELIEKKSHEQEDQIEWLKMEMEKVQEEGEKEIENARHSFNEQLSILEDENKRYKDHCEKIEAKSRDQEYDIECLKAELKQFQDNNKFLNYVNQASGDSLKQTTLESRPKYKKSMRGTACETNGNHANESETTTPAEPTTSDILSNNQVVRPADGTLMEKQAIKPETEASTVQTRSQKKIETKKRKLQEAMSINQETPAKMMATPTTQKTQNQAKQLPVPIVKIKSPDTDDVVFVELKPAESGTSVLLIVNADRVLIPYNTVISRLPLTEHKDLPKISVNFVDMLTLRENQDLNDNVVSFLMHIGLINNVDAETSSQTHIFDSLFFKNLVSVGGQERWFTGDTINMEQKTQLTRNAKSVMSWLEKINVFQKKMLLFPVCQRGHWMLLVIVNPSGCIVDDKNTPTTELPCRIYYFDSYFDEESLKNHFRNVATSWLESVWDYKNPAESSRRFSMDRVIFSTPTNIPKQDNGNDCGVFVAHFCAGVLSKFKEIVSLSVTEPLNWNQVSPDAHAVMRNKPRHDVITKILKLSASETRIAIYSQWRILEFGDYE